MRTVHFGLSEAQWLSFLLRVVLVLLTLSPCFASSPKEQLPETVTFKNGDRLSGHLILATRDSVKFSAVVTGEVLLKWKDISELSLSSSKVSVLNIKNPNGFVVEGPVIEVSPTDLCIKLKTQFLQTFPIAELVSASVVAPTSLPNKTEPPTKPYFRAVGGTLKLSPESVIRATQKQAQLAGNLDLGLVTGSDKAFKHQATTIAMEANYTDSRKPGSTAVITELYSATLQQNFYMTDVKRSCENCSEVSNDGPYLYGITNFYHNLSLGMSLAQSYGAGVGWDGGRGRSSYSLAADIRYLGEDFYGPTKSLSLAAAGLGEQYAYTFPWPIDGWSFSERILFLPAFNDSHAFQLRGTAGIDVPIGARFSFDVDLLDDYLRNPPPKSLQNYAKVVFSLKYVIGSPPTSHSK